MNMATGFLVFTRSQTLMLYNEINEALYTKDNGVSHVNSVNVLAPFIRQHLGSQRIGIIVIQLCTWKVLEEWDALEQEQIQ
jgi:hypothetical protein